MCERDVAKRGEPKVCGCFFFAQKLPNLAEPMHAEQTDATEACHERA